MLTSAYETFPPHVLREYTMLADGARGALIGPRGDVVWMCAPQWHDDAVFSSLLGGPGMFGVTPTDSHTVWGGQYEDGTLIWHSRWTTRNAVIECREALAFPGDPHRAVLLRRVTALVGTASVRIVLDARANFGKHRMSKISCEDGVWSARSGALALRLTGAADATVEGGVLRHQLEVRQGEHHDLVLEVSDRKLPDEPVNPDLAWTATTHAWQQAVPDLENTIAPDDARQSYAILRGMTAASGATVAASTMGMPERANEKRNYDYRYGWIRDQCYVGQGVAACGAYPLLDGAVRFVSDRLLTDGRDIKPAYTVDGDRVPDEWDVGVPGYPGGAGKAGNWVNEQFQLDNFGESLLLFAAAANRDRLDLEHWRAAELCVDALSQRWQEPDAGIWELDKRKWAHSRLTCAAGLRALSQHAPAAQASQWASLADTIMANVTADCLHPSGRWQRSPGDDRVDASLLLPAIRGALPHDDPRSVATLKAVQVELGRQGFLYRFSQDPRPLADAEGAFLLCGFDMAMALHQHGETTEAVRWFERNRAACGSPGLYTEEYDIEQRQLRGNFPQAFVHAAMLESARRLADPPVPLPSMST